MGKVRQKKNSFRKDYCRNSTPEDVKIRPSISDLPIEVMLHIFSNLESSCLLHRVALVCKAWKKITEDPHLWKELFLDCSIKNSDYTNVINKYQFVENIILFKCKINTRIVEAISQLRSLKFMMAIKCTFGKHKIRTDIANLKVTYLAFADMEDVDLFLDLFDLKFTTGLEFIKCDVTESKRSFITRLKECQLEKLHIMDDDCVETIFDDRTVNLLIKHNSDTLVKIYLQGDYSEPAFVNINKCSKLTKLYIISSFKLDDSILFQIESLSNLRGLSLSPCFHITSDRLIEVFNKGHLSNLTNLNLFHCNGESDFSTAIADCCKNLSVLGLVSCNPITDMGLSAIINKCPEIVEIHLVQLLKVKGLFLLEIKGNVLKKLQKINLISYFIEEKYVTRLKKARPGLQINYLTDDDSI